MIQSFYWKQQFQDGWISKSVDKDMKFDSMEQIFLSIIFNGYPSMKKEPEASYYFLNRIV